MQAHINPGGMHRCFECDAFATGVIDINNDGFVRCPTCEDRMLRSFNADTMPPRNPKTGKLLGCTSKAAVEHADLFIERLRRGAMAKVERESQYFQTYGVSASSYLYQATISAINVA